MAEHNDLGKWGEEEAARFLHAAGYIIMERDWHSGKRDIDIIAKTPDGVTYVFVEVKTRRSDVLTSPADAIDARKVRNIGLAADNYVKMHGIDGPLRFDVITIVGTSPDAMRLEHIPDAFNPVLFF